MLGLRVGGRSDRLVAVSRDSSDWLVRGGGARVLGSLTPQHL